MPKLKNRKIQHISDKVKFLRTHDILFIGKLAAELKLHKMRITNLETGEYKADLQDVVRYCDFFGLDYEDFLFSSFIDFEANYLKDEQKMLRTIGYKI